jgi:glycosyltransferase involved in cell wall biosynthesis
LDTYKYPREVQWEIDQNNKTDYINLAKTVNNDRFISGVILQHEYGIFGGNQGENILYFMKNCKKPMVVALHTALPLPSTKMKEVTSKIVELASTLVVLTQSSKNIITNLYPKSNGKLFVIPHGIHETSFSSQKQFKEKLELTGHTVLSTFGLLSRGKGIEYVIQALPPVIKKYPSIIYLILGETHPVIRRNEGEAYRLELARLVTTLGLEKHVKFYDQYLELPDLLQFLQATDIYISSSIDPNQAVSGTLSYALGTGRAVISTEFAQAKEIMTPDIGRLIPIKNSPALTTALLELLRDREKLKIMSRNAFEKTRPMLWGTVAAKYTNLITRTIVPPLNLQHLIKMSDNIGLIQFSTLSEPNKDSGYTLDDNARALIVCSWLLNDPNHSAKLSGLIQTYFTFLKKCQNKDGSFINYIGYSDQLPTDQNNREDSEDTLGRALWALSVIMNNTSHPIEMRNEAKQLYMNSLKKGSRLTHLRAMAFAMRSFALASHALPEQRTLFVKYIGVYADALISSLKKQSFKSWFWFEKNLNYSNALLCEGLLIAGNILKNANYTDKGIKSLQFLIEKTFTADMYMPIGHTKWYEQNGKRSQFDQQPEDPTSMILVLSRAYETTKNDTYKNLAKKCFSWFLGNNSLQKPLYDDKTGGCFDGLHPDRVNLNQGAESLVSYLMASYTIEHFTR